MAASGLRGRGGAGFQVAAKWEAAGRAHWTVVLANGDEGDCGSPCPDHRRDHYSARLHQGFMDEGAFTRSALKIAPKQME
ncbi:hypothetical protein [Streptomyces sp. 3330]|uniref:hypothetical protein n=1 Tax=Streptomyces sp. 3330 TaxID=2817755 RepID=UPI00286AAFEE|nr:hypothetical protein [Streptomyces sp. 3330]